MRALERSELEAQLVEYLKSQQDQVDAGADVERTWKTQRRSAPMKRIVKDLRRMTGKHERCMYCEDSRGTDVEHFWPKRRYPERAFRWLNLLWVCAGCNRVKSARFPRDAAGQPLLIDPTAVDPWNYLWYDSETDELTARWDPQTGEENPMGVQTLEILATLRYQAVAEGRGRTRRNLQRAVRAFLGTHGSAAAEAELRESVADNDGYGLTIWFFLREGREESPFSDLRGRHSRVWERMRLQVAAAGRSTGSGTAAASRG